MFSQCCENVATKKIRRDNVKNTLPQQIHNKSIPETFLQQYTSCNIQHCGNIVNAFFAATFCNSVNTYGSVQKSYHSSRGGRGVGSESDN